MFLLKTVFFSAITCGTQAENCQKLVTLCVIDLYSLRGSVRRNIKGDNQATIISFMAFNLIPGINNQPYIKLLQFYNHTQYT